MVKKQKVVEESISNVAHLVLTDTVKGARDEVVKTEHGKKRGKKYKNLSPEEKDELLLAIAQSLGLIDDKGNLI